MKGFERCFQGGTDDIYLIAGLELVHLFSGLQYAAMRMALLGAPQPALSAPGFPWPWLPWFYVRLPEGILIIRIF